MIKAVPQGKNIFFWGLRSYRLYEYRLHKNFYSWNCRKVSNYVYRNKNIKFFVSDSMIKSEFVNIGIAEERLVIRPERVIFKLQPIAKPSLTPTLNFLSIGSIRPEKRIEKILGAIRELPTDSFYYTIAGKTDEAYEQIIQQSMIGMQNVQRLNYRLSEKEYYELIANCDFLVLCDIKMPANVTNGTLSEALLQLKPVIAPNYDPYKTIIEQNKVGILYDPDDASSLKLAMKKAFENKSSFYYESLVKYQRSFLFSSVVEQFHKDMELCLKN